jgi:hypothetical protein
MGKVWPADSVAYHESTTALSNIVSLDESPLMEGLIYAGTDDGLLQVTEDGGKNWRKIEDFPGVPKWTYVSDIFASPRDVNTVFVALNNWQRGDYKPYLVKSADKGRTWTSVSGNLSDRHDVWSVIQDHINGNLLFAGTEFGLFTSVDGGANWVQLKGGLPTIQVRDMAVQKRENDLVLGTFGRGFYVLDDYSPLREITPQTLAEDVHLFPLRDPYLFSPTGLAPAGTGHRRHVGQLDEESAVRRRADLQRQASAASRREARGDDHGRRRTSGAPHGDRQAAWPPSRAVEPAQRFPTARSESTAGSWLRRPRWSATGAARRTWPLSRDARKVDRRYGHADRIAAVVHGRADRAMIPGAPSSLSKCTCRRL